LISYFKTKCVSGLFYFIKWTEFTPFISFRKLRIQSRNMASFSNLDPATIKLIKVASDATERAYAPYSCFRVGTALQLESGEIVTGANVENAAYPQCLCSEQVALATKATVSPQSAITRMVVVATRAQEQKLVPVTPCGACRQVLLEFEWRQKTPIKILMQVEDDVWIEVPSVSSLLPYAFVKENLKL
jgi:cytidine deaminase